MCQSVEQSRQVDGSAGSIVSIWMLRQWIRDDVGGSHHPLKQKQRKLIEPSSQSLWTRLLLETVFDRMVVSIDIKWLINKINIPCMHSVQCGNRIGAFRSRQLATTKRNDALVVSCVHLEQVPSNSEVGRVGANMKWTREIRMSEDGRQCKHRY